MSDLKLVVALVNNTPLENMSRFELLNWVNTTIDGQYKKIEDLYSGVAYCQMLNIIYPNSINLKRIKINANMEHEVLHNLKIFQSALARLKIDKTVPIERLLRKRFQDNFEFLQWFKKFYDIHNVNGKTLNAARKSTRKTISPRKSKDKLAVEKDSNENIKLNVSPNNLHTLKEIIEQLRHRVENAKELSNYSYKKLLCIEKLLKQSIERNENVEWCKRGLNILHNTENANSNKLE